MNTGYIIFGAVNGAVAYAMGYLYYRRWRKRFIKRALTPGVNTKHAAALVELAHDLLVQAVAHQEEVRIIDLDKIVKAASPLIDRCIELRDIQIEAHRRMMQKAIDDNLHKN